MVASSGERAIHRAELLAHADETLRVHGLMR
jgi:hypothetical protein